MFSSKKDIKEFLIVFPLITLIIILLYYAGIRISLSDSLVSTLMQFVNKLMFILAITLIIDLLVYIFLFIPVSLLLFLIGKKLN